MLLVLFVVGVVAATTQRENDFRSTAWETADGQVGCLDDLRRCRVSGDVLMDIIGNLARNGDEKQGASPHTVAELVVCRDHVRLYENKLATCIADLVTCRKENETDTDPRTEGEQRLTDFFATFGFFTMLFAVLRGLAKMLC